MKIDVIIYHREGGEVSYYKRPSKGDKDILLYSDANLTKVQKDGTSIQKVLVRDIYGTDTYLDDEDSKELEQICGYVDENATLANVNGMGATILPNGDIKGSGDNPFLSWKDYTKKKKELDQLEDEECEEEIDEAQKRATGLEAAKDKTKTLIDQFKRYKVLLKKWMKLRDRDKIEYYKAQISITKDKIKMNKDKIKIEAKRSKRLKK